MKVRGLVLTDAEESTLESEIARLIQALAKPEVRETATGKSAKPVVETVRPNIQEVMREKAREAAGELEGMFDDYYNTGKTNSKVVEIVASFNVMPQHIPLIVDIWKKKQAEFEELVDTKDAELKEAYHNLGKIQLRNILKFIEQVLSDLNSYISIKKANKTPRKKKAVPVEKIVAKLKYLKVFKDATTKLDLISVHPTKLHGASEAWVYDTAKRKLHHYVADEYTKTFQIKGNTLLGFDSTNSEMKTLRKPGEQIKEVMGSKPAARKYFKEIKAVSAVPNGRFNENMIILKAF
jgi:thermostable 8-oxoguanine DNA glycosylase